jgi:hypothetical protein
MVDRKFLDEITAKFGSSPNPVGSGLINIDYKITAVEKLILDLEHASDESEDGNLAI